MIVCTYREDGSDCSTEQYEANPDKYRGLIYCKECGEKTWYVKGYTTSKLDRMACFAARHLEGCTASTLLVKSEGSDEDAEDGELSHDIRVDLDKAGIKQLYISKDNDKHGDEPSSRLTPRPNIGIGGSSGYPLNKSLRALLTNLCRNPNYGDKGQTINIVADGGRSVINDTLANCLVPIHEAGIQHIGKEYIFWGQINNLNIDKNGTLWLNYGDYRKEPSISISSELKDQIIRNFKIKEVGELDGSDVIIVGHIGISPNNKVIISTGFTKYLSFRKVKLVDVETEQSNSTSNEFN